MAFRARRVARRTSRRTSRRMMRRMEPAPPPPGSPPGTPPPAGAPPVNYLLMDPDGPNPPVKITEAEGQRIQQDTGLPPEQLEDADLAESMQKLNIHSAPLSQNDYAALGLQPPPHAGGSVTTVARPPSPPPPITPVNPQAAIQQQLQSLQSMKDSGLISEDDYNAKKKQVLGL